MARFSRYFLPVVLQRLGTPFFFDLKLFTRTWLNVLLPHRLYRYRRILGQPHQRLHLGFGSQVFEGWTNVDMNPEDDFTLNLCEGLPFNDGRVKVIFTEHTLEHFYWEHDAPFLVWEFLRVIKPGGSTRLAVPDAEVYVKYYVQNVNDKAAEDFQASQRGFHGTPIDVMNSALRWKYHHFYYMYDEETLPLLLKEAGFVDIRGESYDQSSVEEFRTLDSEARQFGTLYTVGRKAA